MATVDNFPADEQTLQADAAAYEQYEKQLAADQMAYQVGLLKAEAIKNPEEAFMAFFYLLSQQGSQQSDDQMQLDGQSLKIQGDLTRCGNDIETVTNSTDVGTDGSQDIRNVAADCDAIMGDLKNQGIIDAIGSDATQALSGQYQLVRNDIHIDGEDNNTTAHFDPNAPAWDPAHPDPTGMISSYGDLQTMLSIQGDPRGANEAEKIKTDAFNENTATTQSTNAASNEQISSDSAGIKAIQAFLVAMAHAVQDVSSAAIKASGSGG